MNIKFDGLTMNQLAERNAELVTEMEQARVAIGSLGWMTLGEAITLTMSEKNKQIAELQQKLDSSIAAERVWETTMMQVCGEDGPASVAAEIKNLRGLRDTALVSLRSENDELQRKYEELVLASATVISELQGKAEGLAVENARLKPSAGLYFSYGSEHGFNFHKSAKEAIEAAEGAIDDYRGDACDGWSEEVDSICWGVIMQSSTKVGERLRTEDDSCDPSIDTICDYALLPSIETPVTDAAIAEIEAKKIWGGKGLPPVGCECEVGSELYDDWFRVEVVYQHKGVLIGLVKSEEHYEYDKIIMFGPEWDRAMILPVGSKHKESSTHEQ